MEQYERIPFNRAKAEAWAELYPILQQTKVKGSFLSKFVKRDSAQMAEAVRRYLATLVQCRIALLTAAPFLPHEDALGGLLDETLAAGVQHANHPLVEEIAAKIRIELLNILNYAYHAELELRYRRSQQFPVCGVLNYDPEEEEGIRAEWAALRTAREAQTEDRQTAPPAQANDNVHKPDAENPAQQRHATVLPDDTGTDRRAAAGDSGTPQETTAITSASDGEESQRIALRGEKQPASIVKKRGRPITLPTVAKEAALAVRAGGGSWRETAKVLYGNIYPSKQQIKNAPNILKNYKRTASTPNNS